MSFLVPTRAFAAGREPVASPQYAHAREQVAVGHAKQADPSSRREVERLVAEGLALDAIGERLGVHRRTILRWVERDADFRQRYERARRLADELLYNELREVVVRPAVTRRAIYTARRSIMRRAPKKYGCLPPELRPRLLY